jgi:hypothetical protein
MSNFNPIVFEIENYVKTFRKVLTKPQIQNFEHIIKSILFKNKKSINSYSKSINKDQSSLNRFMKTKSVDDFKIYEILKNIIESKLNSNLEKDLIIDDTLKRHKYSKHIYGLSSHHDHLNGGYSKSHNLVTGGIYQQNKFYPTNCKLYQRQVDVCESSSFKTKIDMAQEILDEWIDKVQNVMIDSWYSSQDILKFIVKKKKYFFTMLKRDRLFKSNKKIKRQLQEFEKYLAPRKFEIITIGNQTFAVQEIIGYLPKVGKVKILFSKFYDKKTKLSKKLNYLCTNNINLSIEEILVKYKDRWPIETFYKDIKQNLGFEKCIIRNEIGIKRHFLLSFIAYSLLIFSKKKFESCGLIQENLKSNFIKHTLQDFGLSKQNLERCKQELLMFC